MPYTLTHKQFYEGLKNGKLLGLKCKCCQKYTIPPRMTCMECGSDQLEIIEMKGEGEIRTLPQNGENSHRRLSVDFRTQLLFLYACPLLA